MTYIPPAARSSHAFTLIELLVTISVLGILAVIAAPSLTGVMERAKKTQSLSNLRQIGVGFHTYAAENNGKFPFCYDSVTGQTYAHFIQDYLPQKLNDPIRNVFVNPAAEKPILPGNYTIAITYSAHPRICNEKGIEDTRIPLQSIARPSQVILLADGPQMPWNNNQATANFWNPWQIFFPHLVTNLNDPIPTGPDTDESESMGWFRYRNQGAVNALMADGHAQSFKKGTVTYANLLWDR